VVLSDLGEHRLKDVEGAVPLIQLGSEAFPPLKTISNTNLPRPANSFVGREAELGEVLSEVEQGARLLTLSGPGGSGKTRLALEAATTLVPEYRAGVFWVGLAALRDPSLVTEQIAQTLGAKDELAEHIGEREMLLLIDNLEQVVEAAPELSRLLQACPNLTLLCTSRELLRVQGEVEYAVPPLASSDAVSLFCERSHLEPSDEIAKLCARVDNLPLAVELAAARTKALSRRRSSTASPPASTCSRAGETLILASRLSAPPSAGATSSFRKKSSTRRSPAASYRAAASTGRLGLAVGRRDDRVRRERRPASGFDPRRRPRLAVDERVPAETPGDESDEEIAPVDERDSPPETSDRRLAPGDSGLADAWWAQCAGRPDSNRHVLTDDAADRKGGGAMKHVRLALLAITRPRFPDRRAGRQREGPSL
jgi:NB-ARC domain-containing protein